LGSNYRHPRKEGREEREGRERERREREKRERERGICIKKVDGGRKREKASERQKQRQKDKKTRGAKMMRKFVKKKWGRERN